MQKRINKEMRRDWICKSTSHFKLNTILSNGYKFHTLFDKRIANTMYFIAFIEDSSYQFKISMDITTDYPFKFPAKVHFIIKMTHLIYIFLLSDTNIILKKLFK